MKQLLITTNGVLFANEFIRVVHGERGDYVEFTINQIIPDLHSKFTKKTDEELLSNGHYYEWLFLHNDPSVKIYKQLKGVKYADYKPGLYYVSPNHFMNFKDPEKLF